MGVTAAVVGGAILGLGATALMNKKPSYSMPTSMQSGMIQNVPEVPEAPTLKSSDGDGSTTNNAEMEAARERELQAALLHKQQSPEILTSGLGATGEAGLAKKSLLGG